LRHSWRSLTTYAMLLQTAEEYGDHDALVSPGGHLTYQELAVVSTRLANGLASLGIGQGNRVATLMESSLEWVILKYALSKLGAIIVPLNIRLEPTELCWALKKAGANALVLATRRNGEVLVDRFLKGCPDLIETREGGVSSNILPHLHQVIRQGENSAGHPFRNFDDLVSLSLKNGVALELGDDRARPFDLEAMIFTSGSTSTPKGALLSHRNVIGHAHYLAKFLKIHPCDRYLNMLPFYHIAGYVQSVLMSHYVGGTLYLVDDFSPQTLAETIERERITASAGMPVTLTRLLDYARDHEADLSSLRTLHGVSPEEYPRLVKETKLSLATRMYGLTESAGLVSLAAVDEETGKEPADFIGYPLPGVSVRIEDEVSRQVLTVGEPGEIVFNGWNRFQGYFDDAETTTSSLTPDGFFKTGDCGYLDGKGGLHFSSRYKDIIKTGGENVSAAEVEQFLKEKVPGIQTAFVVGLPDEHWGEAVTAVVEMVPGFSWEPLEIAKNFAGQMSSFKIPKHFLKKPAFDWPVLASGKIDKQAIKIWAAGQINKEESNAT
jgi:fatty-acyl-CoA synthase